MKVVWTILRNYNKKHGKLLREDLITDLIDMGVPQYMAEELLHKDSVQWSGKLEGTERDDGGDSFIALDIVDERKTRKLI